MRLTDGAQHTLGQLRCLRFGRDTRLDDSELVAAEPRDDIGPAQYLAQTLGDALEQRIAGRMTERVVDGFEMVKVNPQECEAVAWLQSFKPIVERLAEVEAIGDLRHRVMPRQPGDLLFGLALLGDVFLQIDPTALRHGLIGDEDDPPVFEMTGIGERPATCQLGHMVFDPVALLFDILRGIRAGLAFDVVAHDVRQRRAPPRQAFGQIENLSIHSVADDEPLLGVEHGQPASHIVKSNLEPAVELVDLLFMRVSLVGVLFERSKRAR